MHKAFRKYWNRCWAASTAHDTDTRRRLYNAWLAGRRYGQHEHHTYCHHDRMEEQEAMMVTARQQFIYLLENEPEVIVRSMIAHNAMLKEGKDVT